MKVMNVYEARNNIPANTISLIDDSQYLEELLRLLLLSTFISQ